MNNSSLFRLRPIQRVKAFRLHGMRIKVVPRVSRPFGGEALAFFTDQYELFTRELSLKMVYGPFSNRHRTATGREPISLRMVYGPFSNNH